MNLPISRKEALTKRKVYIVGASRTPFLKVTAGLNPFSASDLAVAAGRHLLLRQHVMPTDLSQVIVGCAIPAANEANIARIVALRLACGFSVPAWTVQRNCASGLQAITSAAEAIASGESDLVLAGGTDAMSHAPLLFRPEFSNFLQKFLRCKTLKQRLQVLSTFRLRFLKPVIALLQGLTDPIVGLSMGQTAENLATQFAVTREQMDAFAWRSHQRAAKAEYSKDQVVPLFDKGRAYENDDGVRANSRLEKLACLRPLFDRQYGRVTAGNSCQVSDGAAFVLLASGQAVDKHRLEVAAEIVDSHWAALDPACMGLGPVHAATAILQRQSLALEDIDYWEINAAFAAQVLSCLRAWDDEDYCKKHLGLTHALGVLNEERLNRKGGAIALGHPIGASGARIVQYVLDDLCQCKEQLGMAAICIGGGQGAAGLIEAC